MAGANGTGGGPPKGSWADSTWASTGVPLGPPQPLKFADPNLTNYAKGTQVQQGDVGHPPPTDPIGGEIKDRTKLIYRQIPIINIANDWPLSNIRAALQSHNEGIFEGSGQLADTVLGDARIQCTLGSRISGLFGHDVRFKAANDSDAAKECLRAWQDAWPHFATNANLVQMHIYSILMGFMPGQLLWDTSGPVWKPRLEPWHPRYVYFNWYLNRYVALSQDGELPIVAGDGKWILHSNYGEGPNNRAWIFGAIRALAEPYTFRHFAIRDLARYTEVHGMPIRKAVVPASADEVQRDRFAQQLAFLGNETTIMVQTGADGAGQNYDLELVEAKDTNWEAMIGLRDHCDMDIILAILFQNLTTEVKGGSFAAASAHMDIRASGIAADNASWRLTLYEQVARVFAWINFGDADLAPWTDWDVKPLSDWDALATMLGKFGTAVEVLRRGGVQFENPEDVVALAKSMGLTLPPVVFKDPIKSGGLGQ